MSAPATISPGYLANMLTDYDLVILVHTDLRIVTVSEGALALHDSCFGVSKADLLLVIDLFARVNLLFPLFKGLFGCLDFFQPLLFESQVFRNAL